MDFYFLLSHCCIVTKRYKAFGFRFLSKTLRKLCLVSLAGKNDAYNVAYQTNNNGGFWIKMT